MLLSSLLLASVTAFAPARLAPIVFTGSPAAVAAETFATDPVLVDWRILGGLDLNTGKAPASLEALDGKLVKIAQTARNLKGHGLDEGISTRLVVYAATLIRRGVAPQDACRMAMVRPITDDADIRATLDHAVDATFA